MAQSTLPHVTITSPPDTISMFATVLQAGIKIQCPPGVTVGKFLHSLPDFSMEYITEVIETIFLDGNPVDDLEDTFSAPNQTLALSSSMPGLAGAILRRNSFHAALRSKTKTIATSNYRENTTVLVKLFNTVAQARGPRLLKDGVIISAERLDKLFTARHTLLERSIDIEYLGKHLSASELITLLQGSTDICLTIHGKND